MADDTPPRQMSLIPYSNDNQAIVLRRGNAVVVYDPASQQLQVRNASDDPDDAVEIAECPYCHHPYRDDITARDSEDHGAPGRPQRPFVDPEYFGMLAASQRASPNSSGSGTPVAARVPRFFPAALRSGRSRDVSGSAEFVGSAPAPDAGAGGGQGISSSAFNPGFFRQHFTELGILGKGGNGEVLLVEHFMDRVSLGQFACKRVPVGNDHRWLEKVLIEVRLLQKLPHRNLVQYHFVWLEDHQPNRFGPSIPCLWILQEYCNAGDLHSYVLGPKEEPVTAEMLKARKRRQSKGEPEMPKDLRGPSRLTFDEIFSFFRDITSGLHYLHTKGYIHRDLKPSNCLLQQDGAKTRVLISDFGEVQAAGAKRGSTGATGTISYCAPEVLQRDSPDGVFGDFTTKSDIFSLGMIVYFMCFGRLPYNNADDINEENEDLDQLRAEITKWSGFNDETRARPDLPEKLYRFLKRLLSVDPNERPSTGDILDSIRAGASINEAIVEEESPRVSSLDSPSHRPSPQGRKQSAYLSRPGLSTLRRKSSVTERRALSPVKSQARGGSRSEGHSRPLSPVDGAVIPLRPRKIELPGADGVPTPQQSPRLMLPPPPERPIANRFLRSSRQMMASNTFRGVLFFAKIALLLWPCTPYVASPVLLYPLFMLATLDLAFLEFELRRSLLLLGTHLAAIWVARQYGYQCERPAMVWEDI